MNSCLLGNRAPSTFMSKGPGKISKKKGGPSRDKHKPASSQAFKLDRQKIKDIITLTERGNNACKRCKENNRLIDWHV